MRLLIVALLSVSMYAADARLTAADVFHLERAAEPQIAPDGTKIVYVRHFADIKTDKRYSNLWVVNTDGSGHRPLTTSNFNDSSPRWSPDGTQLLFLSNRDGSSQIWRLWLDSGQPARVTNLTSEPASPAWSPDGRSIAFVALVENAKPKLIDMPKTPEGAKWADPAKVIDTLVYRFNGAGYLKPGYEQLFVVPSEGGTPRQISTGNFHHGGAPWRASEPVWTPDGLFVLISANRHANYEREPLDSEVYEFRASDGTVRSLTDRRGPDNSPAVSPDGRSLAWTGFDDRKQGHQTTRLYLGARDGSNARVLTAALNRDVQAPRWAPDNSGIYFIADDRGTSNLHFISLSGQLRTVAQNLGSGFSSYAGGGSFTVGRNGAVAFAWKKDASAGDVAITAGGTTRVVTALNDDLFAGKQLGAIEEIVYESAKDQRKIQGWILKPPAFDTAKKYPLVLEIHGGPFAAYGPQFDIEKQLLAAAGYVVLYVNPRGSTSYGEEFANLIHHAYPGDDFDDLNSGVDAVVAKGYIDPKRLYVTGGSGGGVLTCWMIGRSTRFRAAVTVYPVINWYAFVLTSDIGNWVTHYWFPGFPWDNVEHYEKRSLLSVVKNVKTPTMVMTGEADYRTPMSDSEQYYQALQMLGVESVLVRVPEEPHGISVRPSHHIAKILHIVAWFDRHP